MRLMGIDLAWMSARNGSGVALGSLQGDRLVVEDVRTGIVGLESIVDAVETTDRLSGIAIDAPLIIRNAVGSRPCERALAVAYGSRWASCHPANLALYPDAASVRLAAHLQRRGFMHLADPATGRWQLECYPHPAIIELFGLDRRLLYKKGGIEQKRQGQARLARLIESLERHESLGMRVAQDCREVLDVSRIATLRGQPLKDNEDALDALICLYVAGLYATGGDLQCFGDSESGYIVIPGAGSRLVANT